MSIRSATVVLSVFACSCVHGTAVFTAGDIFWISKKPMKMYEVTAGQNHAAATPQTVFAGTWESMGNLMFTDDGSAGYLTVTTAVGTTGSLLKLNPDGTSSAVISHASPTALAILGGAIYLTSQSGTLTKVVNGSATQVLTGLGTPRAMLAYEGGLLISEQTGGRIRRITFNGSTPVSSYFQTGLVQPVDMAILNGGLYYTSQIKNTADETITQVVRIDLTTGVRTDHAWGQRFWGLTVAGGRLLSSNYKESTSQIWDITNSGNYASVTPWATGLPGYSDLMLATVPGTPPAPPPPPPPPPPDPDPVTPPAQTPEPSALVLIASGVAMIALRGIKR
jgi:hypothetical protein